MAVLEVLAGQKHQSFLSSKISCAKSLRRKPKISQKPEQGESLIFIRLAFLYILIELGFEAYAERNIKLFENLSNNLLSCWAHWSSDSSNEFIESNISASVNIEVSEKLLDFTLSKSEHVISHSFCEFIFIKRS